MEVNGKTVIGFTSREVCAKSGLSDYQVQQLRKKSLLTPTKLANGQFLYRFQDLVVARDVGGLLADGATFAKIVDAYETVRRTYGGRLKNSSAIKIIRSAGLAGGAMFVQSDQGLIDPETGERGLDFDQVTKPMRTNTVRTLESLRVAQRVNDDSEDADDWYQYALDCEDDENTQEAKRAYEICIHHDEDNADAWVNLGRLHFLAGRQLDSRHCYEKALDADPVHQIANYNLGILFEVFDSNNLAIEHLKKANHIAESLQCLSRIYKKLGDAKRADRYMAAYFERSSRDEIEWEE